MPSRLKSQTRTGGYGAFSGIFVLLTKAPSRVIFPQNPQPRRNIQSRQPEKAYPEVSCKLDPPIKHMLLLFLRMRNTLTVQTRTRCAPPFACIRSYTTPEATIAPGGAGLPVPDRGCRGAEKEGAGRQPDRPASAREEDLRFLSGGGPLYRRRRKGSPPGRDPVLTATAPGRNRGPEHRV
jgi:hypothetical protein